jgi:photosystem II stability/assembly factor-like uncharacterized protein
MRRTYRFLALATLFSFLVLAQSTTIRAEVLSPRSGAIRVVGTQPASVGLTHNVPRVPESKIAAAEQSVYIPSAAHLSGAAGTNWRTDLELHNPGTTSVTAIVALLERDQANPSPQTAQVSLAAGKSRRYDDVLMSLFGFSGAAALRVTPTGGSLLISSRTYNDQPSGTYGQFVPAFAETEAFSRQDTATLIQLSQGQSTNEGYRTNIGLVNLGETTLLMEVRLFTSDGVELGAITSFLHAYELQQINQVFQQVTADEVVDGFALVTAGFSGGSERFLAYASVVDNRTGDPVFLPAQRNPAAGSLIIPAAAHVEGAAGTDWRTDLELYNPGTTQCEFAIELLARDQNNAAPASMSFHLGPGLAARYPDVLATVFSFTGAAALRVRPSNCLLQASSRTFNNTPGGTYGQLVPGRPSVAAVPTGVPVRLIGLSESGSSGSGFRTNIGFVNTTSSTMRLTIDLYDASGVLLGTVPSHLTTLRPSEFRQVDRVFRSVTSSAIANGYAVLSTNTPDGAFFAFASVVDNRTGDPVFMSELQPVDALKVTKQFEETTYFLRDVEMLTSTTGWAVGESHWDGQSKSYVTTLLKTTDGGTTWSERTTGEIEGLNDIEFVGGTTAWAVGENGLVIHSADGGDTWTRRSIATTDELRAVSFVDAVNGWATAVRPTHWNFVGDEDNWTAAIWHTTNGGQTWTMQQLPTGASILHGLQFLDSDHGWAVGARYIGDDPWPEHRMVVYHTSNGGRSWTEQYAPDISVSLTDIEFVDSENGWMVGFVTNSGEDDGATFRTSDGGTSWERLEPGGFSDLLWDIEVFDSERAYIVGANYLAAWGPPVFRTMDGGASWEKVIQERHDSDGLHGLAFIGDGAIAVGDHDYVSISDDAWGEYGWPNGGNLFVQNYISTHYKFEDVFFADQDNGWAVGRKSFAPYLWGQVILHTSNGGLTWAEQFESPPRMDSLFSVFRLDAVTFVDTLNGWATGRAEGYFPSGPEKRGAILHTSDGGLHWEEQGLELMDGLTPEFFDVQFFDAQHGWALETGHYDQASGHQMLFLAKTDDGGANWSWVPTGVDGGLAVGFGIVQGGLHFTDPTNGWAVGGLGHVVHTSDGGQTWQKQDHDAPYSHMMQVSFTNETTGWIAAEGGFLSTIDGGQNWTIRELGVGGDLHDLAFPTAATGWAVGDYGNILRTGDGGATWSLVESGTGLSLLGLHCVRADLCWAVGSYGEILRIGRSN